jgi:hypothetical protein
LFAQAGSVDALASSQFGPAIDKDVRLLADALGPSGQPSVLMNLAEDLIGQIAAIGSRPEPASTLTTRNETLRRPYGRPEGVNKT